MMKSKVSSNLSLVCLMVFGLLFDAAHAQAFQYNQYGSTQFSNGGGQTAGGQAYSFQRRQRIQNNKNFFYLGMCVGQTLAKQGIYTADVTSGATTGTQDDLKSSIKAAMQTCRDQQQASPSPTPEPTPTTPTGSATSEVPGSLPATITATITSASES